MKKGDILELYKSKDTVFTIKELAMVWRMTNANNLKSKIKYYLDQGELFRVRRGVYATEKDYNLFEAANKIYSPSYVSFETILQLEGVIFQYSEQVFLAASLSRQIEVKGQAIVYRKLKEEILINKAGIVFKDHYYRASKERALMDMLYLNKNYYFDNLRSIDWQKCLALLDVYQQESLSRSLRNLSQNKNASLDKA
jgi:predicted transcriptional regulator of viral defense system